VQYRHIGGPVGVDQRLTIYEDGQAQLEEHHRSRAATELTISAENLAQIRDALDQIPEESWSGAPALALVKAKAAARQTLAAWFRSRPDPTRFELRKGGRAIAGEVGEASEADNARALLDEVRIDAIRRAEQQQPT